MRRIAALLAIVVAAATIALDTVAGAATPPVGRRGIDVVQVEGYLDAPNVSLVLDAISEANTNRSTLLILQVKSNGAIDTDIDQVVRAIRRSRVPVAVWVGPSGADAGGAATVLLEAAHLAYVSPGSGAGPGQPVRLDEPGASTARVSPTSSLPSPGATAAIPPARAGSPARGSARRLPVTSGPPTGSGRRSAS